MKMNMFGFDKIKKLATDNIQRVVNTDFHATHSESEPDEEEDFEDVLLQENKKLKVLVNSLLQEKESISSELEVKSKELRQSEDDKEDLKVKSLMLASQKQMLQMQYKYSGKYSFQQNILTRAKPFLEQITVVNNEEEEKDTKDIDTCIAELKGSLDKYHNENTRLKQDLEKAQANIEAERNVFLTNTKAEVEPTSYSEQDYERKQQELKYLIQAFGLKIDNEKDYLREIIQVSDEGATSNQLAYYIMRAKIFEQAAK